MTKAERTIRADALGEALIWAGLTEPVLDTIHGAKEIIDAYVLRDDVHGERGQHYPSAYQVVGLILRKMEKQKD